MSTMLPIEGSTTDYVLKQACDRRVAGILTLTGSRGQSVHHTVRMLRLQDDVIHIERPMLSGHWLALEPGREAVIRFTLLNAQYGFCSSIVGNLRMDEDTSDNDIMRAAALARPHRIYRQQQRAYYRVCMDNEDALEIHLQQLITSEQDSTQECPREPVRMRVRDISAGGIGVSPLDNNANDTLQVSGKYRCRFSDPLLDEQVSVGVRVEHMTTSDDHQTHVGMSFCDLDGDALSFRRSAVQLARYVTGREREQLAKAVR